MWIINSINRETSIPWYLHLSTICLCAFKLYIYTHFHINALIAMSTNVTKPIVVEWKRNCWMKRNGRINLKSQTNKKKNRIQSQNKTLETSMISDILACEWKIHHYFNGWCKRWYSKLWVSFPLFLMYF